MSRARRAVPDWACAGCGAARVRSSGGGAGGCQNRRPASALDASLESLPRLRAVWQRFCTATGLCSCRPAPPHLLPPPPAPPRRRLHPPLPHPLPAARTAAAAPARRQHPCSTQLRPHQTRHSASRLRTGAAAGAPSAQRAAITVSPRSVGLHLHPHPHEPVSLRLTCCPPRHHSRGSRTQSSTSTSATSAPPHGPLAGQAPFWLSARTAPEPRAHLLQLPSAVERAPLKSATASLEQQHRLKAAASSAAGPTCSQALLLLRAPLASPTTSHLRLYRVPLLDFVPSPRLSLRLICAPPTTHRVTAAWSATRQE